MNFSFNNAKLVLGGILMLSLAFTGCLKRSELAPAEVKTYISVLHLAPSAPAIEVYVNGTRETTAMPMGSFFSYYLGIPPGLMTIQFKKASSDSVVATLPIDNYDSLKFHTFVLYNNPQAAGTVRAVSINDDFSGLASDKASYRLFNLSPDSGPVDFYIGSNKISAARTNADIVNDYGYTQFQNYAPGTYTIKAKLSSNDSTLAEVTAPLDAANAYTIFLKGIGTGTGDNGYKLTVLKAVN